MSTVPQVNFGSYTSLFAFQNNTSLVAVGDRNAEAARAKLKELKIRLLADDTGKNYGRTVIFYPETGDYEIRAVGKAPIII